MQQRKGTVSHKFIKSRSCPGEWLLGKDVDVIDEYSDSGTIMMLCDVVIPFTGRFERFRIPKEFIDLTNGSISANNKPDSAIPVADGEQVVYESGLSQ